MSNYLEKVLKEARANKAKDLRPIGVPPGHCVVSSDGSRIYMCVQLVYGSKWRLVNLKSGELVGNPIRCGDCYGLPIDRFLPDCWKDFTLVERDVV